MSGAGRFWEGDLEIDLVAPDPRAEHGLIVGEVKWRRLTGAQRARLLTDLKARWNRSSLAARRRPVRFEVFDMSLLGQDS